MCQAYEAERKFVIWKEERDRKHGKPVGCSFQAGYFQCPNKFNTYALTEVCAKGEWGWRCRDCGTFYPAMERVG